MEKSRSQTKINHNQPNNVGERSITWQASCGRFLAFFCGRMGGVVLEPGLLKWAEERADLLRWLKNADQDMKYGEIIIHYHQGKITSYDICPRERIELENEEDFQRI